MYIALTLSTLDRVPKTDDTFVISCLFILYLLVMSTLGLATVDALLMDTRTRTFVVPALTPGDLTLP